MARMDGDLDPVQEKLPTWVRILVAVVIVVAMLAFVRGRDHHHGDDVGALGGAPPASAV
jgi:type VI protein secretion system component VasF